MQKLLNEMIEKALAKLPEKNIYTFAFYHDHESDGVSICIDTRLNSIAAVKEANEFTKEYFMRNLNSGRMDELKLWNFNSGRSFSLGDFAYSNIVYLKSEQAAADSDIYYKMIMAIEENKSRIREYAQNKDELFFCCSSAENEVEYIWQ